MQDQSLIRVSSTINTDIFIEYVCGFSEDQEKMKSYQKLSITAYDAKKLIKMLKAEFEELGI